jgi:ribonuclease PH
LADAGIEMTDLVASASVVRCGHLVCCAARCAVFLGVLCLSVCCASPCAVPFGGGLPCETRRRMFSPKTAYCASRWCSIIWFLGVSCMQAVVDGEPVVDPASAEEGQGGAVPLLTMSYMPGFDEVCPDPHCASYRTTPSGDGHLCWSIVG